MGDNTIHKGFEVALEALEGQLMSEAAKALTHYANNYRQPCTDDSDLEFCHAAALAWAAAIIAGTE